MPFLLIFEVPKGTKGKTLKHEKPVFSVGFQLFFKVQRWLQAVKMSLFCGVLSDLILECPFKWFWSTFKYIVGRFSVSKPFKNRVKNEGKNETVFDVVFLGFVWRRSALPCHLSSNETGSGGTWFLGPLRVVLFSGNFK